MLASKMLASSMLEVFRGSHKKMPVLHEERASVCKKLYSEHLEKIRFCGVFEGAAALQHADRYECLCFQ